MGTMGSLLVAGADCLKEAVFLSPVMANPTGGADTLENYICIFERATGEPTWRHFDMHSKALDSRPDVELIVRFIATVGNYDYLFDWIFDSKGSLTFRGGATGLDAVKGVKAKHLRDATAQSDTAWGPLIAPGRVGINHDHYFSLRLDVDVDGPKNRFVQDRLIAEAQPQRSPRTAIWRVQPEVAKKDSEAKFRLSYERPSLGECRARRKQTPSDIRQVMSCGRVQMPCLSSASRIHRWHEPPLPITICGSRPMLPKNDTPPVSTQTNLRLARGFRLGRRRDGTWTGKTLFSGIRWGFIMFLQLKTGRPIMLAGTR